MCLYVERIAIKDYVYLLRELSGLHSLFAIKRRLAIYSQSSARRLVMRDGTQECATHCTTYNVSAYSPGTSIRSKYVYPIFPKNLNLV